PRVVARSPDRATLHDRRSPENPETCGPVRWHGQETVSQRRSGRGARAGDRATTEFTPPLRRRALHAGTFARSTRTVADREPTMSPLRDAIARRCRTSWDRRLPSLR